jgi:branched-chain amino acid transport system ATP-binding protein
VTGVAANASDTVSLATALELRDVVAGYGRVEVLHGVDLSVPVGGVVALLGPNGAGKSTLLRVASGRLRPSRGCVHVCDEHVNGARPSQLAAAGVCTVPEGRAIFPNLTVEENLRMMTFRGVSTAAVVEPSFERFPKLRERRRQIAGTLSGGEQQMLAMCRALTTEPSLLLLDEISMGLAPLIVSELYDLVQQIADDGVAVLLVEQFARAALGVADLAAVMVQGRIAAFGEPDDISDVVSHAYLGGGT